MVHRKPRVLLADDLTFFGNQMKFFLEDDFDYTFTSSLEEALLLLKYDWFPIVLIDKRWGDDGNEDDIRGLKMLQEAPRQFIRCLVTSFPSAEEDIGWMNRGGYNITRTFYRKENSHEGLARELSQLAQEDARINWNLEIYPAIELVNLMPLFKTVDEVFIPPVPFTPSSNSRKVELLDLLGKVFYPYQQIELGERLWERDGRLALPVKALAVDRPDREFVLVLGSNPDACKERQAYNTVREYQGRLGTYASQDVFETTHMGANLYHLNSAVRLIDLDPFHKRIFSMPIAGGKHCLKTFLTETLPPNNRVGKNSDLGQLYLEHLGLPALDRLANRIESVVADLVPKLVVHETNIVRKQGEMYLQVKGEANEVFPDPVSLLKEGLDLNLPPVASVGLRLTNLNSILSSSHCQTWLTDFFDAGMLPLLWMPTEFEAAVRYDWTSSCIHDENLASYYLVEHSLESCFYQPSQVECEKAGSELVGHEPCLSNPMNRIIQIVWMIREWARSIAGEDHFSYRTAMFYQAATRILEYDHHRLYSQKELTRFGHLLISMAVIGRDLAKLKPAPPAPEKRALVFEEAQQMFYYLGILIELTPTEKDFLKYLLPRQGELLSRRKLEKELFMTKEGIDKKFYRMRAKLKEKYGLNPDEIIEIVRGEGYRLLNPILKD
jgi:hypothetical protein